jgi:hypothetical protein
MYDKHGSILRVETTINEPAEFRVYREGTGKTAGAAWRPMRKGVARHASPGASQPGSQ